MRTESLLAEIAATLGRPAADPWPSVLAATERADFLPGLLWVRDGGGGHRPLDRGRAPEAWLAAAYSDQPLVTEFTTLGGARVPLSSASAPSTVVRLLEDAGLTADSRVLEIGTGTGFNTALLARRCRRGSVVTLENVPELSALAARALRTAALDPTVVTADGTQGCAALAPYSHVLATCSVRSVPAAWLEQTETGGRIVTPWDSAWVCYGTLVLDKHADGSAAGRFSAHGSYMLISTQRVAADLDRVLRPGQIPSTGTSALSPWAVAGEDLDAQFHIGLAVAAVWHSWDTCGAEAPVRLWLADLTGSSWASVDWDGRQSAAFATRQFGVRRLWDEVEAAYAWWAAAGRPEVGRYGLTVTADGRHTPWLDAPGAPLPLTFARGDRAHG
ncbi:rRNA adenine N-6-methyltransferase family protein [Streptomyces sp. G-G2]|uniref:rRNA adenine N-6-methyltransferase family protein n=1 Tax=Streptomyces sp. G-G2 TaxID=3046201 RepID=UPI0024BBC974|nr:rRNA adenine N-6-methyltransferase family protein [Streptomyces sp. G-G2]MDJ0386216.1 rRNA adenine N-6-methyltransferase family protein [Streptomyces sp. G-G2]